MSFCTHEARSTTTYTVVSETTSATDIAAAFGISLDYLKARNPNVRIAEYWE